MERFVYPPYSIYQGYGSSFTPNHNVAPRPPSKQKQPSWKQSKSSSNNSLSHSFRGSFSAPAPPVSSPDYLDTYKRAQLKALLTHVSPGLTPRLRKANTKEVGIQVNPRVDAAVQCSLGSRALQAVRPHSPAAGRLGRASPTPPLLPGVYSPVLGRRLFTLPEAAGEAKEPDGALASQQPAEEPEAKEAGKEEEEEEEAVPEEKPPEGEVGDPTEVQEGKGEAPKKGGGAEESRKTTFQFLEQKYGYFHCNDCKTRWESAYVWCISGTNKVYFKQLCRKCQKSFNPYKVEAIQCHICSKTRCSCPQKKRHIDLKRPHRQELCGRCKGKRLSCDNTYSFKYII
ncbi:protein ZAR1-like [Pogona vitticeps]